MQNMYLIKGLRATIYKELLNATVRNQITRLKMGKRPEQTPHKEGMQMQDKHNKRCSTSYIVRKMQIKNKKPVRHQPPHTYLNGQNPGHGQPQTLVKMCSLRNSHSVLMGTRNGAATLEDICQFPIKLNIFSLCNPATRFLVFTQRN